MLRAVIQVIRGLGEAYDDMGVRKPMDDVAHEVMARKAALWDLEEQILVMVDRVGEVKEEGL
jgi:hypothetical protein